MKCAEHNYFYVVDDKKMEPLLEKTDNPKYGCSNDITE